MLEQTDGQTLASQQHAAHRTTFLLRLRRLLLRGFRLGQFLLRGFLLPSFLLVSPPTVEDVKFTQC